MTETHVNSERPGTEDFKGRSVVVSMWEDEDVRRLYSKILARAGIQEVVIKNPFITDPFTALLESQARTFVLGNYGHWSTAYPINDFLEKTRADPRTTFVPVIIVSAHTRENILQEVGKYLLDEADFIRAPLQPSRFVYRIKDALARSGGKAPAFEVIRAIKRNDIEALRSALSRGGDPGAVDDEGMDSLSLAVSSNNILASRLLVKHGARISLRDFLRLRHAYSILILYFRRLLNVESDRCSQDSADWQDVVESILIGEGETIYEVVPGLVSQLIKHWRDSPEETELGNLFLDSREQWKAVSAGEFTKLTGRLRSKELLRATVKNDAETVKSLLAFGAYADATDTRGRTSLCYASERGYVENMDLLVSAGASLGGSVDSFDGNPLTLAARNNQTAAVDLLIQKGAPLPLGRHGETILNAAVEEDYLEVAKILLASGCDPFENPRYWSPVFGEMKSSSAYEIAVKLNRKEFIDFFESWKKM